MAEPLTAWSVESTPIHEEEDSHARAWEVKKNAKRQGQSQERASAKAEMRGFMMREGTEKMEKRRA